MKKVLLAAWCIAVSLDCFGGGKLLRTPSVDVVPRPAEMTVSEKGVFTLKPSTKIVFASNDEALLNSARFFNSVISPSLGGELTVVCDGKKASKNIQVTLGTLQAEEYQLSVTSQGVQITAGSPAGVFYAFQTLRQMLPAAVFKGETASAIELPLVEIADKPHFAYRGAMLDVCRHFFTVDEVKTFIDILALHKMNRFHWHLTEDQGWRIEIKRYPELTRVGAFRDRCSLEPGAPLDAQPYGGFYTQDQIREIVKYAADRFITVIPEIEMPGHASAALAAYGFLGCKGEGYTVPDIWGVKEDVYCAGKESTFEFLENVLSEVVELFPSEYIHIGGDECPKARWKECPVCQQRMQQEQLKDELELQSYFVQRIEKFLNSKGKKLIGWDEILEGGLSKTASVMSWRGAAGGIEAAKSGNYVVMSPNSHCYLDYYQTQEVEKEPKAIGGFLPVERVYSFDPYEGLNAQQQAYIMGVQGNLWTEFISTLSHAEYMALPRLAALSEVGWSYDHRDYNEFKQRIKSLTGLYEALGYNYAKHMFE
ncbi:MAG: beta-N-acetylhexosaminidase [Alistipes sp.]|nr:beta-N-acetylhexosaminidase [Alistipes sp.]